MNTIKTIKNTSVAMFVMLLCLVSINSQAATFPVIGTGDHTFYSYNEPGKFTDRWDFSVAEDSKVSAQITDLESKLNLFGHKFSLLDNKKLEGSFEGTTFGEGGWASTTLLAGVDYSLYITGKAKGWLGGMYKLDVNVAPVPVPAALGLFVIALAGFARFSKRSSAVAA